MVAIIVTDPKTKESETFTVHKKFICHYSPYFDAAFNGNFIEGVTQKSEIEGHPAVFSAFVSWIYTQKLEKDVVDTLRHRDLYFFWIMADRFMVPRLQNQIMENLYLNGKGGHPAYTRSFLEYVYENTAKGSPLRKQLVEAFTRKSFLGKARILDDWPPEILVEMVLALNQRIKKEDGERLPLEAYFVPEDVPQRRG